MVLSEKERFQKCYYMALAFFNYLPRIPSEECWEDCLEELKSDVIFYVELHFFSLSLVEGFKWWGSSPTFNYIIP